ncbi:hypothetical protein NDU88_006718 [Pleurodeles waltl]|uniref:Uncharacterized protein n=1 Tax=Pleurodeles waltl TaxID=8319 RepID=A0AAV7N023_PLEWA|nr:hypothetical protein NDU88_006718 [Pleurodeles waltl]
MLCPRRQCRVVLALEAQTARVAGNRDVYLSREPQAATRSIIYNLGPSPASTVKQCNIVRESEVALYILDTNISIVPKPDHQLTCNEDRALKNIILERVQA